MRLQFYSIPVHHAAEAQDELNRFLATHRVVAVDRELIHDGANSFWAVSVSFAEGESLTASKKPRIDYREVLSESDFAVYAKLRSLRKELSEREGVPAYALFKNEHLASMVTQRVSSLAGLQEIAGIGPSRVEKYGAAFLGVLKSAPHRAAGPDETNNDQP